MKLKKVLAGVVAAAMAVTTMAVTSFTASAAITNENGSTMEPDWGSGTYMVKYGAELTEEQWKNCYGIEFNVTTDECDGGQFNGVISNTGAGADYDYSWYGSDSDTVAVSGTTAKIKYLSKTALDAEGTNYNTWSYLILKHYWSQNGNDFTVNGYTFLDADGNDLLNPPAEEPPAEEEPTVPESGAIWEGTVDLGTDWGSNVPVSDITAKEGDKLVVYYTIGAGEYQQVKLMDGSWTPLTAPVTNDYDCVELAAGTSSYEVVLNADDAAALTSGGLVISGYNVTITKIELVGETSGEGEVTPAPEPEEPKDEPVVDSTPSLTVVPNVISVATVPTNSAKVFEFIDSVTGKTISASVNMLAKALSRLTEGSELTFDTGSFGLVLRKNVIQKIVDNGLTLTVNTSKATFIIDAENLAKVKTINIPAILKTSAYKELSKEGNTFNVIVTENNKVEIELA